MPIAYVSQRLGRGADIARMLERGGCDVRLGPEAADPKAVTRFTAEEIPRWFGDVDALVVGTGEAITPAVVAGAHRACTVC